MATFMFNKPQPVPSTGFGLLGMTWRSECVPDEQAFAAMKAAINNGATHWSSASAYGVPPNPPTAGLALLRRYFEKYPEDAPKVTLFIRACIDVVNFKTACTKAEVRASYEECESILGGAKKMDIFGPARMDANVPIDETIGACKELVEEGKIGAVGLSEVSAETIIRAHAVHPISAVEIEFSLWSTDMLSNGVAAACKERDIPIWTYAPLGYGFLTGKVRTLEDIPKGDIRLSTGRFQPENFPKNLELADKLAAFATDKRVTAAQLALAWIRANSNSETCGPLLPIPGATAASRVQENCKVAELTSEEKKELDALVKSIPVAGIRGIAGMEAMEWT